MKNTVRMLQKKWKLAVVLSGVILLIITGMVMIYSVLNRYGIIILQNEDSHLFSLTYSVDRSIENYLHQCMDNLTFSTGQKSLAEAEKHWMQTNDSMLLLHELKESLVGQDEKTADLLILYDGEVRLSTSGQLDYQFTEGTVGESGEILLVPCLDENERMYLAFVRKKDSGAVYAMLIDPVDFYEQVAGDLTQLQMEKIMLLWVDGKILIRQTAEGVRAELTDSLKDTEADADGLSYMLQRSEAREEGAAFCRMESDQSGETYAARMAVVPAGMGANRFFTVGIAENYDAFLDTLESGMFQLLAYGWLAAAGAAMLVILFLHQIRSNARVMQEAEALRKKNEAMEALNLQTQKLAHHQRLEIIGTLTSSIAHEFNNLLTPIMGYSMLALEKLPPEDEELYDNILEIYNTSRKAKHIISRLSDLARKNGSSAFRSVSPDDLVRKTLEVIRPAKPAKVEIKAGLDCWDQRIQANEIQLSQLLMNLILNGFHAMEKRGGVLTVSTFFDEENIHIHVEDTGCGIPEEIQDRIFEPFFSTKESGRGTGLGLAIAAQVVEDHHGEIRVVSRVDKGTCFMVSLPRSADQECA